jgi:hypothetical protein
VTLGDADFRKSLMKMVYMKLPKQRHYLSPVIRVLSLPALLRCHPIASVGSVLVQLEQ